ncbi:MAG TPA: XRE family transcriptional regulator [Actinotalea caeni]|uniref:helix-turn-helix domain-containing protein n=1 Tax=Actinotalea caeni TaxID=1348467 RepID=UPI001F0409D0|nr:XRE family transcriptional regulator [Actinotalea caeni]HLV55880.1 XRE family transcriptional regulator [Actinotalea caeni]
MADLPIPVPDDDAQVAGLGAAVKAARKRLDLSIAELAQTAGVSLGFVSQLERGIGNPSLATISKLAAALGLTVSQLLEEPASDFAVVRAGARYSIPTDPRLPAAEQVVRELLTPRGESMLQVIRSTLPVGFSNEGRPFRHIGTEAVTVLQGTLVVVHGERRTELGPGDTATYGCSAPHWWANGADEPTVVLGAVSPFER